MTNGCRLSMSGKLYFTLDNWLTITPCSDKSGNIPQNKKSKKLFNASSSVATSQDLCPVG